MAEAVESMHFAANSKTISPKPLIAKRPPESRPQSSIDTYPPPPKKVRLEEKGLKPRKVNGEVCAGEKHNGKQSYGSPAKWSFGPAKPSHSAAAAAAAVPAAPVRKIFKISNFLASPPKVKRAKEKRHKEKEKSAEAQRSSAAAAAADRVSPASCRTKTENGDAKPAPRGRGTGSLRPDPLPGAASAPLATRRAPALSRGPLESPADLRPQYLLGPGGENIHVEMFVPR